MLKLQSRSFNNVSRHMATRSSLIEGSAVHDPELGSALMHFFSVENLPTNEAGNTVPKTIQEFIGTPPLVQPHVARQAAEKLAAKGFMIAVGQKPGPPDLMSAFLAVGKAGDGPDAYDFIVGGFPEIRRRRSEAVLHLDVTRSDGTSDSGSGFLISESLMVTAKHCIENKTFSILDPRDGETKLEIAGQPAFRDSDFAVVPIVPGHGLPVFSIGKPNYLDEVMALGYPRVEGLHPVLVTSTGQVAGQAESYLDSNPYWLTTCALTGGSSGGPVVNERGQVVGVVSAIPAEDLSARSAPFGVMVSPVDGFESLTP